MRLITNLIIEKLHQKELKLKKIQISNLIHRFKVKQYGPRNMTLNELKLYCDKHKNVPDDQDEVFVAETYFQPGIEVVDELRIFLTTKRLICMATKANHLCIDANYKLLWLDYPVIVVGTTDLTRSFHSLGLYHL